ncbi:MAG: hypothetical protein ACKOA8_16550, partial [Deltaproteobacteria bacterium]
FVMGLFFLNTVAFSDNDRSLNDRAMENLQRNLQYDNHGNDFRLLPFKKPAKPRPINPRLKPKVVPPFVPQNLGKDEPGANLPLFTLNDNHLLDIASRNEVRTRVKTLLRADLAQFNDEERQKVEKSLDQFVESRNLSDLTGIVDFLSLAQLPQKLANEIYTKKNADSSIQEFREKKARFHENYYYEVEKDLKRDLNALTTEVDPNKIKNLEQRVASHVALILVQAESLMKLLPKADSLNNSISPKPTQ